MYLKNSRRHIYDKSGSEGMTFGLINSSGINFSVYDRLVARSSVGMLKQAATTKDR